MNKQKVLVRFNRRRMMSLERSIKNYSTLKLGRSYFIQPLLERSVKQIFKQLLGKTEKAEGTLFSLTLKV